MAEVHSSSTVVIVKLLGFSGYIRCCGTSVSDPCPRSAEHRIIFYSELYPYGDAGLFVCKTCKDLIVN